MGLFRAQSNFTGRIYPFNIIGDTPTPEEDAFISRYIMENERPTPTVEEESAEESIFGQAVGRGVDLIQRSLGSAIEGVGKTTGIDALQDYGAEVVANNDKEIQENSDKAVRLKDINDIGSFFDWTASTLGEQLPNLGYTLAGSGAGAAIGSFVPVIGTGVGAIVGGITANLPFFYGSNREAQKEEIEKGNKIEVSEAAAALAAIPQSVFDFIADRLLVSGFSGKLVAGGGIFTKGVGIKGALKTGAKGVAAGTLLEVPTEIGQQVLERLQAGKDLTSAEALDEYLEVGAAAALLGGTVRGTGATLFGQKDPGAAKFEELAKDQRLEKQRNQIMANNAKNIVEKIKANPNVKPEEETTQKVNESETKTQDLLDAAKETTTPFLPIKLADLDPNVAQKIRQDRIKVNRENSPSDVDADTTVEEIEIIVGEEAANLEKAKQKPNLTYQSIMDLDNELVNLDGTLDSKMKEKKKLQVISKEPKDNKEKADAEAKITEIDNEIEEITATKKIKEEKYRNAINAYLSRKQKKKLDKLQYVDQADDKASPEAEKISTQETFEPTKEYFDKKDRIQETLQKELNDIGLSDVKVKVEPLADDVPGRIVEGFFGTVDGQKTIGLSMALYSPQMNEATLLSKLRSVMSHEIIHAVRNLGIITPKEYKTLVDAAKKRKYVFIADGKPIVRNYSYLDRAVEMNRHLTSDEKKAEEAVAELFRDWASGKIKLVAQPKTIFGKIINAIKAIFNAHAKEGFTKADQIFQNIVSTDKEKQIGARQRAGSKTEIDKKERSLLEYANTVEKTNDFFEAMGEEGVLMEVPRIKTLIDRYIRNNNRSAIEFVMADPDYEIYKSNLDANLNRLYPDGNIPARRITNYAEVLNDGAKPKYTSALFKASDIVAVGNDGESEVIVNLNGDLRSYSLMVKSFFERTPYNQKVQNALSEYAKGNLTAKETRKIIRDQGFDLDATGLRTGFSEINVYPISDKMKENVNYEPQVYDFSALETEEDAGRLQTFIKDNPDGFTIDVDTLEFTAAQRGIAVAPVKIAEFIVDPKNLTTEEVYRFAETVTYMSQISGVKMFAGGWFDTKTNKFYLDATQLVDDFNDALYLGDAAKQEAIFNLETFEETRTQDGIRELKKTSAYDSNAHDERRRYVQQLTQKFQEARDRGETEFKLGDVKTDKERTQRKARAENRGIVIEPETDEYGAVTLTHYSPISDLEEIKPEFQGTNENMRGEERARRSIFSKIYTPRNYYGLDVDKDYGYKREGAYLVDVGTNVYTTKVPLKNIYNADLDDRNLKDKAKAIADKSDEVGRDKMLYQATVFENLIKDEGFIGYYSNNASLGLTAAIYQPLSVKPAKDKEFSALELPGGAKDIGNYLLRDEAQYIFEGVGAGQRSEKLFNLFTKFLPSAFEMANVAVAGIEKKGWYKDSAKALVDLFGVHDARRFAALLAAMSPQVSVNTNLEIALATWVNWNNNGRPKDPSSIDDIAIDAIGNRYMSTIRNNSRRALSAEDGKEMSILLSGPKVNSFMLNLVNNVMEVTNDTWMATYAAIDIDPKKFQDKFKRNATALEKQQGRGVDDIGRIDQKSVDYIALSARTREAAQVATELTGEPWTPAEIQETVWSITRALGNTLKSRLISARELLTSGELTNFDVANQDDFATLVTQGIFEQILERGGYGERLRLINPAETGRIDTRGERSVLISQNSKIDPNTFRQEILNFGDRIQNNVTTARINRQYSALPVQPEFDLVSSPTGKRTFGVVPFRGKPLNVLFPVGRHFSSNIDLDRNKQFGDDLGSFGLNHIKADRPGIKRKIVNHAKDLLKFTNYRSPEDGVYAMISKLKEYFVRDQFGRLSIKENNDFDIEENFDKGNIVLKLKPQSKLNNKKAGNYLAPLKLVLVKGSRKKADPEDTSGLPPVGSFENPNIPEGASFYYVKTFFNEDRAFSALEVQNPVPEGAVELDEKIVQKEENIRYNNLAPFLAKPLKIIFPEDKATALAEKIVVQFQDAFQPVGKMLDELRKNGLSIVDALDPYLKEKNFHGIVKDLSIKANENLYEPMGELIKQINVDQADLDRLEQTKGTIAFRVYKEKYPDIRLALADLYLYALHAKERNEFVQERKGRGLGSSMSDSEAQIYLDWFNSLENNSVFASIATKAQEIAKDTTNQRMKAGLIPSDEMEAMNRFKYYVPLRGDISQDQEIDEDLADAIVPRTMGTFFGAKGRPDPTITKGRPYKDAAYAEHLIATLMSQNQKTIELAERNKVGLSFLNLIRGVDTTIEGDDRPSNELAQNMESIAEVLSDEDYKNIKDKSIRALHIVSVRENGKDINIFVRDSRIARAMKHHYSPTNMNALVRAMSKLNRFLSNVNTSWNPSFVIPNLFRDLETAGVNIQQYDEKGITKEIVLNVYSAIKGIATNLRDNDKGSEWAKEYLLFREYGGQNATNQMGDLETQVQNLKEVLDGISENSRMDKLGLVKNGFLSKGKSLLKFLDDYNTAVENGVRVATFRALRNRGMTLERAAEAARDITVNFAKGGEQKALMNAWFLFYNASLQGSMALFNAAVKSKRVRKFWAGMIVYGILQDQVNAILSGDEDEDGILDYDELSTYELEHNLILPIDWATGSGDKMLKIPLGYGLNMAVNTGRALSRLARGEYTAGEATNTILATMTEMINPLGGTESLVNFAAPTIADPFVSLYINKDYKGDPITKDSPTFASVPTPDSHSHWSTTGKIPKAIVQTINSITGGNELRSGLVDMSPDTIQFWFDYVTGGAGRFVLRTGETMIFDVPEILAGDFEGKIVPRIPLARKVIATPSEIADTGTYLENRKELFTIFAELDLARRAGDTERLKDVTSKYAEELRVYGRVKAIDNARNRLLRQIKKIERNPRLEDERKKQLIRNIRKKINDFQKQGLILMRSAGLREAS